MTISTLSDCRIVEKASKRGWEERSGEGRTVAIGSDESNKQVQT